MDPPHPHPAVALCLLALVGVRNCSGSKADDLRPPLPCLAHPELTCPQVNPLSLKLGAGQKLLVKVIVDLSAGTYAPGG